MRRSMVAALGGTFLAAACAGGNANAPSTATSPPWVTSRAQSGSQLEKQVAKQANSAQAGTVQDVNGTTLVLNPYQRTAGAASFALAPKTPVFQGGKQVSMSPAQALHAGMDVNVFFDRPAKAQEQPRALGIQILSQNEAQQLRREDQAAASNAQPSTQGPPLASVTGNAPSQAGRIQAIQGNQLVLDPFNRSAGTARLQMGSDVSVYYNGNRVGRTLLYPGADVRVFYQPTGAPNEPQVIAVQILTPQEASKLKP